jgi:hypothetical protein
MTLTSVIALMIVLVMPDGEQRRLFIEQPSMEVCFEQAWKFMQRRPAEFKAIAIGAGCVFHPQGRHS